MLCVFRTLSQMENINWVFPDSSGLNFLNDSIQFFNTSLYGYEASASISDTNGNLLFYTNGEYVWNKSHLIMPNGYGLDIGGVSIGIGSSITQGVIIVPKPNDINLFYIFQIQHNSAEELYGLKYSIVDMTLNEGWGDIVLKNQTLIEKELTEKMQAVKHGNGRDWWLLLHAKPDFFYPMDSSYTFIKYLISIDGIEGPFEQKIGPLYSELVPYDGWGEMVFSEQGDRLAYTRYNRVDIYDFDRCTGLLSNWIEVTGFPEISLYGCSFSSFGNNIYVSQISSKGSMYQISFNNDDTNKFAINEVFKVPINNYVIGQHQIFNEFIFFPIVYRTVGSDVTSLFNQSISYIINANDIIENVLVDTNAVYLEGKKTVVALPNMPNYSLGALQGSECDTLSTAIQPTVIPEKNVFSVFPNPASDYLQIETNLMEELKVIIRDSKGSVCLTAIVYGSAQMNVRLLPSGIYSVTGMGMLTGKAYSEKFVKL